MNVTNIIDADYLGTTMVEFVDGGEVKYRDYQSFVSENGYSAVREYERIKARERVIEKEASIARGGFVEVGICDVVDRLGIVQGMMNYDEECEAVNSWCHRWDVMLYERPKESFFKSEGRGLAKEGGFRGVLFSNLS